MTDAAKVAILLVDDEAPIRSTVRRALERWGYAVHAADSLAAAEAIWRAEHSRIGALVTDVLLGEENGAAFAIRLRRDRPDLPVVIVSGYTGTALATAGTFPADAHFLEKPFALPDLRETLRTAIAGTPPP
ncbi:MAG TPA: response regulator [Gemmatimonadales bacterium]|nr:response regulator [Gemmatimonadales bacterium]